MTLFDFFAHSAKNAKTTSTRHVQDIVYRIITVSYRLSTYYHNTTYINKYDFGIFADFHGDQMLFLLQHYTTGRTAKKLRVDFRVFRILFAPSSSAVFFFFTDATRYTIAAEFRWVGNYYFFFPLNHPYSMYRYYFGYPRVELPPLFFDYTCGIY